MVKKLPPSSIFNVQVFFYLKKREKKGRFQDRRSLHVLSRSNETPTVFSRHVLSLPARKSINRILCPRHQTHLCTHTLILPMRSCHLVYAAPTSLPLLPTFGLLRSIDVSNFPPQTCAALLHKNLAPIAEQKTPK